MRRTTALMVLAAVTVVVLGLAAACSSSDDPGVSTGTSVPSGSPGTTSAVTGGSSMTTTPATTVPTAATLDGQTFVSTAVTGHELVAGTSITMTFTDADLNVGAGCNSMAAGYTVEGSSLAVGEDLRSTTMGCPSELSDQDTWLAGWLTGGLTIAPTADGISLTGGDVTVELAAQAS